MVSTHETDNSSKECNTQSEGFCFMDVLKVLIKTFLDYHFRLFFHLLVKFTYFIIK